MILAFGALWSSQVSAGELHSVYVAPGGVYIASAQVYLTPGNADPYAAPRSSYYAPAYVPPGPAYAPGYVPAPVYWAPSFYGTTRPVYPAPSVYLEREPTYPSAYAADYPPRPPAPVPYGGRRCIVNSDDGLTYCNGRDVRLTRRSATAKGGSREPPVAGIQQLQVGRFARRREPSRGISGLPS